MSLKPDRHVFLTETNFVFNSVLDSGFFLSYGTAGSGNLTDDLNAGVVVQPPNNPSGVKPAGLLVNPFVTFDPFKHRNTYKVTQFPGEKATLLRKGWVTTNVMPSGLAPNAGDTAYLGVSGMPTNVNVSGTCVLGEWMGQVDADGYARLFVDLPATRVG